MKFLIFVCTLALASASAYEKVVPLKDLKLEGSTSIEGRVTNGQPAWGGQFPYQVGLSLQANGYGAFCGGSIIGVNWVVTAAHCTNGMHTVYVYAGSTRLFGGQVWGTNAIHQHPGYNSNNLDNDISLIWVSGFPLNGDINIIRMPARNGWYDSYDGWTVIVSGWGGTYDGSPLPENLQWTRLSVMSNGECANYYGGDVIRGNIICVRTPGGQSTCQGDSGGPLAVEGQNLLIGVTSFVSGAGCQSGGPAGFARITSHLDWIAGVTGISH